MKITKLLNKIKTPVLTVMVFLVAFVAQAQGVEGINAADTEVRSWVDSVGNLVLAIGGIVGLVGAIRVYIAWNNGDQDVTKKLMGWLGACLFLVIAGGVISGFFGV
ncbi:MAG: DUF4134 domain-containing protein [Bacteroidota bacterium]